MDKEYSWNDIIINPTSEDVFTEYPAWLSQYEKLSTWLC